VVNLMYIHLSAFAAGIERAQIVLKLSEVAQVVAQGVLGNVALILQVLFKTVKVFLHSGTPKTATAKWVKFIL
jgi:hypothetical protein